MGINKSIALSNYKLSKHINESVIPNLSKSEQTLEGIITQLCQSSSDKEYLEAISEGTLALKQFTQLLDPDNIANTFDDLAEALDHQSDIDAIIHSENAGLSNSSAVDENELETELEELIAGQKSNRKDDAITESKKDISNKSAIKQVAVDQPQHAESAHEADGIAASQKSEHDHSESDSESVAGATSNAKNSENDGTLDMINQFSKATLLAE
ncbi:hypothetical protein AYI68_g1644 [Smittium mucronatum]|uniref:Uncharacterized protein n=1 Tax=Smittium mucronatum TaxID=133383 RepID=A0A1R0H517_9FUNG|nr:hypothetical protein AYI68_g1644 [Smittium mucronatum]